jgi:hypothetical protein
MCSHCARKQATICTEVQNVKLSLLWNCVTYTKVGPDLQDEVRPDISAVFSYSPVKSMDVGKLFCLFKIILEDKRYKLFQSIDMLQVKLLAARKQVPKPAERLPRA